jgi:membrane fusion protein, multidrug efflux system
VAEEAQQPPQQQHGEAKPEQPQRPEVPEQRRHRRRILWGAGLAAVVLGALALLWWLIFERGFVSTDDAYTDGRAVSIAAKVSGYVQLLAVNDNQPVLAGSLLIRIQPADYHNALDEARGRLAQTQAQLEAARVSLTIARVAQPANLREAEAERAAAQAALERAQADLSRQLAVNPLATTRTLTDQIREAQRSSTSQLTESEAKVSTAKLVPQNIQLSELQVRTLEGELTQAQAEAAQAVLNVGYTDVVAPQDGRVTRRAVEQGDYVQVGQQLMLIVTPDVWVTANFKEGQLAHMRVGQPVSMKVDAYPGLTLHGHVQSFQMGSGSRFSAFPAENATGNFVKIVQRVPVKILIDSGLPAGTMLPLGLSVDPTVNER